MQNVVGLPSSADAAINSLTLLTTANVLESNQLGGMPPYSQPLLRGIEPHLVLRDLIGFEPNYLTFH